MAENFADRLIKTIKIKKSPVCVGIDPVYSKLPSAITQMTGFEDGNNSESSRVR